MFGSAPTDTKPTQAFPFQRKEYFLTNAERSFFGVLQGAVGQQYLIFAKVRLADLVFIPKGTFSAVRPEGVEGWTAESPRAWRSHMNRIQSKHIDFVLCDRQSVRPLVAIELDDSSHQSADRQARDTVVEGVLEAAGLPLFRIAVRTGYNPADLTRAINEAIGS